MGPFLRVLDPLAFPSYFERSQDGTLISFPRHSGIRLPCGFILLLANVLVLVVVPGAPVKRAVINRLGPLIVTNMAPLFLLAMRHSPLADLLLMSQPELLWAHAMLGAVVIMEVVILCFLELSDVVSPHGKSHLRRLNELC